MFHVDGIEGKVAWISGGAGDLGSSMAKELARQGAAVAVTDLSLERAEAVADEIKAEGGKAKAYLLDAGDFDQIYAVADQIEADFGSIDILCTSHCFKNTKYTLGNQLTYVDQEDQHGFDEVRVNLHGSGIMAKAAIKRMRRNRWGRVILISSVAGLGPEVTLPTYSISKAAINMLGMTLAKTHGPDNINVNVICPGMVNGTLWQSGAKKIEELTGKPAQEVLDGVAAGIPLRRLQEKEDFGYLAAFLCSDQGNNITGQIINIDGGVKMG